MATLSKQDRIEISLKLVGIEKELEGFDNLQQQAVEAQIDAQNKDAPNKKIIDEKNLLINPYQKELTFFDGIIRTELTEDILEDSARRILGNSFFPNNTQISLPSIPDGAWKYFPPFSGTHAIGKASNELYPTTGERTELDILDEIETLVTIIESAGASNRATGKLCVEDPPDPDYYEADLLVVDALADLKLLVDEWETILNDQKSEIPTDDPDATRQSGNTSAIADIDNAISIIDAWQAVQDYDTTTTLPLTCAEFDSKTESFWQQAKLQPTTLQSIKDEIDARQLYIPTRVTALEDDYLGSIIQDLSNGNLTAFSGLYGERMLYIDVRLNTLSGTLSNVIGLENSEEVQKQFKNATNITKSAYSLLIKATKAAAPGLDTKFLNVLDASEFNVGDRIYLVANDQEELSGAIAAKDGNRIELTFKVPKKYTTSNVTRIYKLA